MYFSSPLQPTPEFLTRFSDLLQSPPSPQSAQDSFLTRSSFGSIFHVDVLTGLGAVRHVRVHQRALPSFHARITAGRRWNQQTQKYGIVKATGKATYLLHEVLKCTSRLRVRARGLPTTWSPLGCPLSHPWQPNLHPTTPRRVQKHS